MTEAFIRAAEAKGHTVTRFDAADMKLGGCNACETCYKTGKACSFDDDFNTVAPAVLEADAVVFTMPVYWYSIPAQIKCILDKMYAFCVAGKDVAGKACALIACCEEEGRHGAGRRADPGGAFGGAAEMARGRRSARARRAERRRHRKDGRLPAGGGLWRKNSEKGGACK